MVRATIVVWILASTSSALAAEPKLVCQAYPAGQDCLAVEPQGDIYAWPTNKQLSFVASCVECEGGGNWDFCQGGGQEKITIATLSVRETNNKPLTGSFSKLSECIGSALYLYDGKLSAGSYWVVASLPEPHGETLLFELKVGGASKDDGGARPSGDGGTKPASDAASTPPSDSSTTDSSTTSDDASGETSGTTAPDEGCGCTLSKNQSPLALLLLIVVVVFVVRRRLRN